MTNKELVLSALRKLAACYGKSPTKAQTDIYLEMLAELEPAALDYAVNAWIKRSPFFPRVSELLQTADSYHRQSLSQSYHLYRQHYMLEQLFTDERKLDPQAWQELAQRFELLGMTCSASSCRKRYQHRKALLELENDPQAYAEYCTKNRLSWQQPYLQQGGPAEKEQS